MRGREEAIHPRALRLEEDLRLGALLWNTHFQRVYRVVESGKGCSSLLEITDQTQEEQVLRLLDALATPFGVIQIGGYRGAWTYQPLVILPDAYHPLLFDDQRQLWYHRNLTSHEQRTASYTTRERAEQALDLYDPRLRRMPESLYFQVYHDIRFSSHEPQDETRTVEEPSA